MDSRDSEKMRLELESFLNSSLKPADPIWPVKNLNLLEKKAQTQEDTGVLVRERK